MAEKSELLLFFKYDHLPESMQVVSKEFSKLAEFISELPKNCESSMALRKLLEAKDCAVRSLLLK
jgi:hypothetical protein